MYYFYSLSRKKFKQFSYLGETKYTFKEKLKFFITGQIEYWKQLWNLYEWLIIFVFIAILVIKALIYSSLNFLELYPYNNQYFNIHYLASLNDYYHDILGAFIVLHWIRLLKFFRISPLSGPIIQSIFDTLKSKSVIIFVTLIVYTVVIFGLGFYLTFGTELGDYEGWSYSMITLYQFLFQQFNFNELYDTNNFFGPFFFIVFTFFCCSYPYEPSYWCFVRIV